MLHPSSRLQDPGTQADPFLTGLKGLGIRAQTAKLVRLPYNRNKGICRITDFLVVAPVTGISIIDYFLFSPFSVLVLKIYFEKLDKCWNPWVRG